MSDRATTRWTAATVYPDMWVDPDQDPRDTGSELRDDRATLTEYLRAYRLTLEMKCAGLNAEQLARRSVPPSDMSLLVLVRHLAEVERFWFRRVMARQSAQRLFISQADDLGSRGQMPDGKAIQLREVLVHMIEEYARHCGHADLLRERIDGRVGQRCHGA